MHILCLPAHKTHLLQPLDMGVFKYLSDDVNSGVKFIAQLDYSNEAVSSSSNSDKQNGSVGVTTTHVL